MSEEKEPLEIEGQKAPVIIGEDNPPKFSKKKKLLHLFQFPAFQPVRLTAQAFTRG